MFKAIRQRLRDMKMIKVLCIEAEKIANAQDQKVPGAEHFVLSALAMTDGTARKAFLRIHADPANFRTAITQQYQNALKNIGIAFPLDSEISDNATPMPTSKGPYQTKPSAQALMQILTREIMVNERKVDSTTPLLSAHVLLAATAAQYSVAARAIRAMGINQTSLVEAAELEISEYRTARL